MRHRRLEMGRRREREVRKDKRPGESNAREVTLFAAKLWYSNYTIRFAALLPTALRSALGEVAVVATVTANVTRTRLASQLPPGAAHRAKVDRRRTSVEEATRSSAVRARATTS